MKVISGWNVNEILPIAISAMTDQGQLQDSRNGKVLVYPSPVTTVYNAPQERVLFHKPRDCNPFLHFFDGLYILTPYNEIKYLTKFSKQLPLYSDDGETFNGAYGHRFRKHFGVDQIQEIIATLREDPDSRRTVLQMWDGATDIVGDSKDHPCNMTVLPRIRGELLDLTVYNRSNDMLWGAYGANVVQFSMLQEYLAAHLHLNKGTKIGVGKYYQISNNFHIYQDFGAWDKVKMHTTVEPDPYGLKEVVPYPMFDDLLRPELWDDDLHNFFRDPYSSFFNHSFFHVVAKPMMQTFDLYKAGGIDVSYKAADRIEAEDWRLAALDWLDRRTSNGK